MQLQCDMDGHPLTPPQIVPVDQNNQLNMPNPVQEVASTPLGIMKFEIWPPTSWRKYVTKYASSLNCNRYHRNHWKGQAKRKVQGLMSLPMAYGVAHLKGQLWTYGSLTPMLPPTQISQFPHATSIPREGKKKRAYEERVREVKHTSFTPLVLSATGGGMDNEATHFYKWLASRLAEKLGQPYSSTMAWLQCRITFSLLRSTIQCIRGAHSCTGETFKTAPPMDLIITESQLPQDLLLIHLQTFFIFTLSLLHHHYISSSSSSSCSCCCCCCFLLIFTPRRYKLNVYHSKVANSYSDIGARNDSRQD